MHSFGSIINYKLKGIFDYRKTKGHHIVNTYMYEHETMKDLDEGCYMNYAYYQYKHTFVLGIVTQVLIGIPLIC